MPQPRSPLDRPSPLLRRRQHEEGAHRRRRLGGRQAFGARQGLRPGTDRALEARHRPRARAEAARDRSGQAQLLGVDQLVRAGLRSRSATWRDRLRRPCSRRGRGQDRDQPGAAGRLHRRPSRHVQPRAEPAPVGGADVRRRPERLHRRRPADPRPQPCPRDLLPDRPAGPRLRGPRSQDPRPWQRDRQSHLAPRVRTGRVGPAADEQRDRARDRVPSLHVPPSRRLPALVDRGGRIRPRHGQRHLGRRHPRLDHPRERLDQSRCHVGRTRVDHPHARRRRRPQPDRRRASRHHPQLRGTGL